MRWPPRILFAFLILLNLAMANLPGRAMGWINYLSAALIAGIWLAAEIAS